MSRELGAGGTVLRLVRRIPLFLPGGALFPNGSAFAPSSEDKTQARIRGHQVRVSVWDRARTTVGQAMAFRGGEVAQLAYELALADVSKVRVEFGRSRLRVVEDPLEELQGKPGGDGHCGIEGLDTAEGERRKDTKTIQDELARRARRVGDAALEPTR